VATLVSLLLCKTNASPAAAPAAAIAPTQAGKEVFQGHATVQTQGSVRKGTGVQVRGGGGGVSRHAAPAAAHHRLHGTAPPLLLLLPSRRTLNTCCNHHFLLGAHQGQADWDFMVRCSSPSEVNLAP
jgi:hypothetical protein